MRRQVPLLITFIVGAVMVLANFVPHPPFDSLDEQLTTWFNILAAVALILGAGDLLKGHGRAVMRQKKGWGFNAITVIAFLGTFIVGAFKIGNPDGIRGSLDAQGSAFDWIYDATFDPLSSTMFSLLAFYVASASYRAFRAKNREATILLVAAFVVLLGQTPVGYHVSRALPGLVEVAFVGAFGYLAFRAARAKQMAAAGALGAIAGAFLIWAIVAASSADLTLITIPALFEWTMDFPQTAGQRAIMIGIALGIISMSLRIILGVERSHLGSDD